MISQQEYQRELKDGKIYAYGKNMPCCPNCGTRMTVHGTCKRNIRTLEHPNGIVHVFRVLDCKLCNRSHREMPDFIVPHRSYSYDYMYVVAQGKTDEIYIDNCTITRTIRALCALILFLQSYWGTFKELCEAVGRKTFVNELIDAVRNSQIFSKESWDSIDLQFSREERHVILSAIQRKGVASNETTIKFRRV